MYVLNKLYSNTLLITNCIAEIGGHCLSTFQSAALSSMFDVGAMIGQ